MSARNDARTISRYFAVAAIAAVPLAAGVFVWTSLPPRTLTMTTGVKGGANYELGIRYREILAREGVKLKRQETAGSLENLSRRRTTG